MAREVLVTEAGGSHATGYCSATRVQQNTTECVNATILPHCACGVMCAGSESRDVPDYSATITRT